MRHEKQVKPPTHLSADAKRWWGEVVATWHEPHPADLRLLQAAAECWDRLQAARRALAKGTTYKDRLGEPRPRPELAIEREARSGFVRLCRALRLVGAEPEPKRARNQWRPQRAQGWDS